METEEKYFIALDMYSGYWKVMSEEEAPERLAFFYLVQKVAVESDAYGGS